MFHSGISLSPDVPCPPSGSIVVAKRGFGGIYHQDQKILVNGCGIHSSHATPESHTLRCGVVLLLHISRRVSQKNKGIPYGRNHPPVQGRYREIPHLS